MRFGLVCFLIATVSSAEVTDHEPHQPPPRFTHVRLDCDFAQGFMVRIDDSPDTGWIYRGNGERLAAKYRQLPRIAARHNPYNFIIHVYDDYNRLCRVFALPRARLSQTFEFKDPDGFHWLHTTESLEQSKHKETDDPDEWPNLGNRRHNNIRIY